MKENAYVPTSPGAVEDLADRLSRFRPVAQVQLPDAGFLGVGGDLLTELVGYWRTEFSWPAQEAWISAYPWVETELAQVPIRAIVSRAAGARQSPSSPVVLLLHGWPDSVLRFQRLFPLLTDLTYVAPALPGFPFAAAVTGGGLSSVAIADALAEAMSEFGFARYVVSAGDVGSDVAEALAARHPGAVAALHLTDVSQYHINLDPPADLDGEEHAYAERTARWQSVEGGYAHEQATRPHTLAAGLGDSPAGLAAWIGEKLIRWTDSEGTLTNAFSYEEALTWISSYWLTGSIGTSFAPYAAGRPTGWPRIEAPTVFTLFPKDLANAPRQFAERFFNVVQWQEYAKGGHFAAWERPEEYLQGIRAAVDAGWS